MRGARRGEVGFVLQIEGSPGEGRAGAEGPGRVSAGNLGGAGGLTTFGGPKFPAR